MADDRLTTRMRRGRARPVLPATVLAVLAAAIAAAAAPRQRPAPAIVANPARHVTSRTAESFSYRMRGATGFECALDRSRFARCGTGGVRYRGLRPGRHRFRVRAIVRRGHRSATTSYRWTVVRDVRAWSLGGRVPANLYPGEPPAPIDVTIDDRSRAAVRFAQLRLRIASVLAPNATATLPCTAADFLVRGYAGRGFTAPRGHSALGTDGVPRREWPTIAIRERPSNQDGCMGATLHLAYEAIAGTGPRHSRRAHTRRRLRGGGR